MASDSVIQDGMECGEEDICLGCRQTAGTRPPFPGTLTLCPGGTKRSRLASVDTVKSFVFFTATGRRMCLSSWESPSVTKSSSNVLFEVPQPGEMTDESLTLE